MPQFKWTGRTSNGQTASGVLNAASREDALSKLKKSGILVQKVDEGDSSPTPSSIPNTSGPQPDIRKILKAADVNVEDGESFNAGTIRRVLSVARENRAQLPEAERRAGLQRPIALAALFLSLPFVIFFLAPLTVVHCENKSGDVQCRVRETVLGVMNLQQPTFLGGVSSAEVEQHMVSEERTVAGSRQITVLQPYTRILLRSVRGATLATADIDKPFPPFSLSSWRLNRWLQNPDDAITVRQGRALPAVIGAVSLLLGLAYAALLLLALK